jgi:hypothetical protein
MTLEEGVLYRIAYSRAYELYEARRFSCQYGRYRNNPAAGGDAERIAAETCRQLRVTDPAEVALVREATEDALGGRNPQW